MGDHVAFKRWEPIGHTLRPGMGKGIVMLYKTAHGV